MRFINPKTDIAFKRIFGSEKASKEILKSFLNAALYAETSAIEEVEILNPYIAPRLKGMKDTFVDVQARLQNGTTVIIEMQVLNVESFEKRILYNAAKKYSMQLQEGEYYDLLKPVIALTITDFIMFKEIPNIESRFVLKDKNTLTDYPTNHLELVFLELPKFTKTLDDDLSILEKWLYFLRFASSLRVIPDSLSEIAPAFILANRMDLTEQELDDLDRKERWILDQRGAIMKALNDGTSQGIERGIAQGIEQGIEIGIAIGTERIEAVKEQKVIEIARNLLDVLDDATISLKTGLSIEIISQLRLSREQL